AEERGIDPESLLTSPVEGLILDLPGAQRRIVSITEHGIVDERQRGVADARVGGHILALLQATSRHQRFWNEELRPPERLHANRERDRLARSPGLRHHPVELVVAVLVDLVPVGA